MPRPARDLYDLRAVPDRAITGAAPFPNTLGSALDGARSIEPVVRDRAWALLVAAYWKPAYKHVRVHWRASRDDAQDMIQGFFERALERDFFTGYDPSRARFRTFFRVCLDRYVSNEHKARTRQKRGGALAALDFDSAEGEIARADVAAWAAPDDCFERESQRALLGVAIDDLREDCSARGREAVFAAFEAYDLAPPDARPTYDEIGGRLGLAATTVTNHLALARRELRRCVADRLRAISTSDDELAAELGAVFGGGRR